jgi:hypothetical protein
VSEDFLDTLRKIEQQLYTRGLREEFNRNFPPEFRQTWMRIVSVPSNRVAEPIERKRKKKKRRRPLYAGWKPDPEVLGGMAYHKEHEEILRHKSRLMSGPNTTGDVAAQMHLNNFSRKASDEYKEFLRYLPGTDHNAKGLRHEFEQLVDPPLTTQYLRSLYLDVDLIEEPRAKRKKKKKKPRY